MGAEAQYLGIPQARLSSACHPFGESFFPDRQDRPPAVQTTLPV